MLSWLALAQKHQGLSQYCVTLAVYGHRSVSSWLDVTWRPAWYWWIYIYQLIGKWPLLLLQQEQLGQHFIQPSPVVYITVSSSWQNWLVVLRTTDHWRSVSGQWTWLMHLVVSLTYTDHWLRAVPDQWGADWPGLEYLWSVSVWSMCWVDCPGVLAAAGT